MDLSISLERFSVPTHVRLAGQESPHRFQGDAGLSTSSPGVSQPVHPTREENMGTSSFPCLSQSTGLCGTLGNISQKGRAPISSGKQQPAIRADAAACDNGWAVKPAVSSTDERHRKKHGRRRTIMRGQYFHFPSVDACLVVTRRRSKKMMPLKFYFMSYLLFTVLHKGQV